MRVNETFIYRHIGGEHILIPVGQTATALQGMIGLSESGELLYRLLKTGCTREALTALLLDTYDVTQEQAHADTLEFLKKMNALGILELDEKEVLE